MNVNTSLTTLNDVIFCPYSIYKERQVYGSGQGDRNTDTKSGKTNAHTTRPKRHTDREIATYCLYQYAAILSLCMS